MEQWKDVPGWEQHYQVSDLGRVRSKDRSIVIGHRVKRKIQRNFKGRILKPFGTKYLTVKFTKPGESFSVSVHRLVLLSFKGRPPEGLEACHNDGNRLNNILSNLRHDTRSANAQDRVRHREERCLS